MLDGDKKAKFLREKEIGRQIPILLLSSKGAEELTRLTAEAGANGFIHKPFAKTELVASVRKALAR
jgi:DNA-binding response OmpR family regulator